jgi:transcription initiation factor TFIIIB Brf1 subunit/transcription initiation factor TFIIB
MPSDHTIQALGIATAAPATQPDDCPECDGSIRHEDHETVCKACGLVIDEHQIDHGPDWRDFDTDPGTSERSAPVTLTTRHDNGVGETMSHKRDATGRQLSGKIRRQLSRLRTRHSRARVGSKQERNQVNGLTDIKRMANALGLPEPVMNQACLLFKTAQDNDLLPGRSIEGFTTAALYAAARLNKTPRPIGNFAHVSKVDRRRLTDSYSVLNRELALPACVPNPIETLPALSGTGVVAGGNDGYPIALNYQRLTADTSCTRAAASAAFDISTGHVLVVGEDIRHYRDVYDGPITLKTPESWSRRDTQFAIQELAAEFEPARFTYIVLDLLPAAAQKTVEYDGTRTWFDTIAKQQVHQLLAAGGKVTMVGQTATVMSAATTTVTVANRSPSSPT